MDEILVPTSPGELVDKLTILRLKTEKIEDPVRRKNVEREYHKLQAIADKSLPSSPKLSDLWKELLEINGDLWAIEDDIRLFEERGDFGPGFVALARSVYFTNDLRAQVKKKINLLLGSELIEEKSYKGVKE